MVIWHRCLNVSFSSRSFFPPPRPVGGLQVRERRRWRRRHASGCIDAACAGCMDGVLLWRRSADGLVGARLRPWCGTVRARKPASAAVHTSNTSYELLTLSPVLHLTHPHIQQHTHVLPGNSAPSVAKNPRTKLSRKRELKADEIASFC